MFDDDNYGKKYFLNAALSLLFGVFFFFSSSPNNPDAKTKQNNYKNRESLLNLKILKRYQIYKNVFSCYFTFGNFGILKLHYEKVCEHKLHLSIFFIHIQQDLFKEYVCY